MAEAVSGAAICRQAVAQLVAAGVPDAAQDVRRLFLHALNAGGDAVRMHHLADHLARPVPGPVQAVFDAAIAARLRRQPVSQIIGRRAFWKHEFRVTPDVLDPRPETETLVAAALGLGWGRMLDLGTGSGAILVSLLTERPGSTGLGVDLSTAALAVAQENAAMAGVRADFLESDWYASVEGHFDLIASNPPYVTLDEMAGLAPELREWEPHLALTDGGDGLGAYRVICAGAPAHLVPGGHLLVEIGPDQGAAVLALMQSAGLAGCHVLPDLDGRDRVVCGRLPHAQG